MTQELPQECVLLVTVIMAQLGGDGSLKIHHRVDLEVNSGHTSFEVKASFAYRKRHHLIECSGFLRYVL